MHIGDVFPIQRLSSGDKPLALDASKYTVLYFYPEDDTPGCTVEANEFQQLKGEFAGAGTRIVGVSVDEAGSHRAFCDKFGLTFDLATDHGGNLGAEMDIMKGSVHRRVTYVVDASGKVVLEYSAVKAAGHARQILDDLASLAALPQGDVKYGRAATRR